MMAWKMDENKILALKFELLFAKFNRTKVLKIEENNHRPKGSNVYKTVRTLGIFAWAFKLPKGVFECQGKILEFHAQSQTCLGILVITFI